MKRTELPERFQTLLARIPYATIATTCPDGQPWNSPVAGRFDNHLNLYWVSWVNNQHSQNIIRDPRIFVVVYDSQVPEGQGEGLYMQMIARPLSSASQVTYAMKQISALGLHKDKHQRFLGECPQRIWKATPSKIWYNGDGDERGHFVDVRHELTAQQV